METNREQSLLAYDAAVALCERFDRKGKTMPYTSSNGHMFSLLNKKGELGIRFSKEDQKKYMEQLDTGLFYSYGAEMRGYVLIPDTLLRNPKQLAQFLNEGYDFVHTLPSK